MTKTPLLAAAALLLTTPAVAQTAPAPAGTSASPVQAPAPVDPARLAAARALVDTIFPPATREQMMRGMVAAMENNVKGSLLNNADLKAAMDHDPRVHKMVDSYLEKQTARSNDMIIAALPGMTSAMAKAYARRFDVGQMGKIQAFFSTPTGQQYMQVSMSIMSDPDVAAWTRDLMAKETQQSIDDIKEMAAQVAALQTDGNSQ